MDYKSHSEMTLEEELNTKFAPKKTLNTVLADSYERIGKKESKVKSLRDCGAWLEFAVPLKDTQVSTIDSFVPDVSSELGAVLHNANFCRDRLCPMCSWRRSLKIFGQVSQIMDFIEKQDNKYRFLFLTLTVRNCSGSELPDVITKMQKAFHKFHHYKRFNDSIKGFFKVLEVTHNTEYYKFKYVKNNGKRRKLYMADENTGCRIPNPSYDTYHPHYHVILAVNDSYFNSRASSYIKQPEWLAMWQKAYGDPTITQVDVRVCKPKEVEQDGSAVSNALNSLTSSSDTISMKSAVAEVAKYSVKSSSYLGYFDKDNKLHLYSKQMIDSSVEALGTALAYRRLCDFGGIFKEAQQALKLDDCIDGDLIHIGRKLRNDVAYALYRFGWSAGAYKLLSSEISMPDYIYSGDNKIDSRTGEIVGDEAWYAGEYVDLC